MKVSVESGERKMYGGLTRIPTVELKIAGVTFRCDADSPEDARLLVERVSRELGLAVPTGAIPFLASGEQEE